ncbi:MAG: CopG family antitoxin [bacterium]|nr:CopG family antitoxin [bacterium]
MPNGGDMGGNRSSISKAQSYKEIGEFWDTHDLDEYWEQTKPVEFELDIQSETTYYPLDITLSAGIRSIARQRGVSPEILLNLWVQEKLQEQKA